MSASLSSGGFPLTHIPTQDRLLHCRQPWLCWWSLVSSHLLAYLDSGRIVLNLLPKPAVASAFQRPSPQRSKVLLLTILLLIPAAQCRHVSPLHPDPTQLVD